MRRLVDLWFGVDLRSLAAFRIAIAIVLLADLAMRASDLTAHYTDLGVSPAALMAEGSGRRVLLSVHYHASSSAVAVAAVFALQALAGLALLVGFRTRLACFAAWYLLLSLQFRNPMVSIMGGDFLLRLLLFWGIFLPLGARFSVDARREAGLAESSQRLCNPATAAILLQVAIVYWTTGLLKDGAAWRDGTAVYYALHLDFWVTAVGEWLREQKMILPWLTHATRWFEMLGPFLAFSPWQTPWLRLFAILAFALFHASLAAALHIGLFPLMAMIGWILFLPSEFWDRILPWLRRRPRRPTLDLPRLPTPWALEAVAGILMLGVVTSAVLRPPYLPTALRSVGLAQGWSMFSPEPPKLDYWPLLEGRLIDRRSVDPLRGGPSSREKPERISATFPSFRWRTYFDLLAKKTPREARLGAYYAELGRYLCWRWNSEHTGAERMLRVRIGFVVEETFADGIGPLKQFPALDEPCRRVGISR